MENKIIGITTEYLSELIANATRQGYNQARQDLQESDWLNSRAEICQWLSPDKPMSVATFNRNRAAGKYGVAIVGRGAKCKARKSDLQQAIQYYELNAIL